MSKKSFMKGAVILAMAGIIVKILGAFFRIPLANIIGDTGMSYYQTAYPVYVLLLAISTAGIPTAIARLVSEKTAEGNHREAYRVFRLSLGLLVVIGVSTCLVLFIGAPFFAGFTSAHAVPAIRAIAPALLLISVMAAFRGYFQGLQDMMPTAVSQIAEQFFRVAAGLTLAFVLVSQGLDLAAAGASFGAAAGGFFGLIAILAIFAYKRKELMKTVRQTPEGAGMEAASSILKRIVLIAVPITIGAAIMPIMSMIDLVIVPERLINAGYSAAQANSLYGQLSGFSAPVINIPQVITQSIALSLVPAVAAAHQMGDKERLRSETELGLRMAMIIAFPCSVGIAVLSKPLMLLLYPTQQASAASAAGSLAVLGVGVIFLSSVQTLTGVLQGIGKQMVPVLNLAVGAVIKVILTYVLTGISVFNIKGAAAGTVCAYLTASLLNMRAAGRYTGASFSRSLTVIRPGAAALLMGLIVWIVYHILSGITGNVIASAGAVGAGMVTYAVLVFAFRVITEEELESIPKAAKLLGMIRRIKK